jgi:hypothetical protein
LLDSMVGQWIGIVRGTDIGNLYAAIKREGELTKISLAANLPGGVERFYGGLREDNGAVAAFLEYEQQAPDGTALPTTYLSFDQTGPSRLTGRWRSSAGHEGVFFLDRADTAAPKPEDQKQIAQIDALARPIEIVAKEVVLPSLRLFRSELEGAIAKLRELLPTSNEIVVAAMIDGREVRRFAKDFLAIESLPQYVTHLSLSINDGRQPLSSTINVNFNVKGASNFFVQSDNTIWVSGTAAELDEYFGRFANPVMVFLQRHGLGINTLLLLLTIAIVPDFPLRSRVAILAMLVVIAFSFVKIHSALN